jgi:hypothetical protein
LRNDVQVPLANTLREQQFRCGAQPRGCAGEGKSKKANRFAEGKSKKAKGKSESGFASSLLPFSFLLLPYFTGASSLRA